MVSLLAHLGHLAGGIGAAQAEDYLALVDHFTLPYYEAQMVESRSLVTITRVSVSDDLKVAKVYFSVMGGEDDRKRNLQGLDSAKGFIKREVGKRTHLRYVPDIVFKFDPSVEYADHIDRVIKELHQEEAREEE